MGCNCGGGQANQTIAQRASLSSRAAAASSEAGFTRDNPLVVGEVADGELWQVRVIAPVEGLIVGRAVFVTGTGVAAYLASGAFHDITTTQQKKRLFKVGAFMYGSLQEANRAAAGTGLTPIEVA